MQVGKMVGHYLVDGELGSGAMGSVFRATDTNSGQIVAIKIIAMGLIGNETAVARFEREANILKQLRHPNIVRIIGNGKYKKTPIIVMEYVQGESLDKVLARRNAYSWEEVVSIGKQLCAALQHAHMKGIIHRDLKPSNLMVLADGTIKLTDFGIAKDTDVTALTNANSTVGTAAYMSPEQCKGERNLSAKSDLYSMGVMFYELLTGRKPFPAETPIEMFQAHVYTVPERPSRHVMTIPVWLDTLVVQLLEKKPELRPFDAQMVASALEEVEKKVTDLRSAGVDAATARRVDKHKHVAPADETDRAAARTLRGATLKKKVRRKDVPFLERKLVKAAGLLLGLAGIAGVAYFMSRPPSAEQLYTTAKFAVEANDGDKALPALQSYLDTYAGRDDERTREVREWYRRYWAEKRETQLHNRQSGKFEPEDDGQKFAARAARLELEGKLDEAAGVWREMEERYRNAPEPDPAVYGWVAAKKRADIERVPKVEAKLLEAIGDDRLRTSPAPPPVDPAERACLEAMRYEDFGDLPTARDLFARVALAHKGELKERQWLLLASRKAQRIGAVAVTGVDQGRAFRRELVRKKLDEAAIAKPDSDPSRMSQAVKTYRDLIVLYSRDPDDALRDAARQAAERLRELGKS